MATDSTNHKLNHQAMQSVFTKAISEMFDFTNLTEIAGSLMALLSIVKQLL